MSAFECDSIRVESEYKPRNQHGKIEGRFSSFMDSIKLYSNFAVGFKLYKNFCRYAVLRDKSDNYYFVTIPHSDILQDLKSQGFDLIYDIGESK